MNVYRTVFFTIAAAFYLLLASFLSVSLYVMNMTTNHDRTVNLLLNLSGWSLAFVFGYFGVHLLMRALVGPPQHRIEGR